MPTCWIIAGPNGAGKTSFALDYLPKMTPCSRFINADLIAAGLSPLTPEWQLVAASRLLLKEIEVCIAAGEDFAFETTLAGRGYLKLVERLRGRGWEIRLIYLALPSMEMSALRVAERVAYGGHNVPVADIRRRFGRSLDNLLHTFASAVDFCECFMNSGRIAEPVFEQRSGRRTIVHESWYRHLVKEAKR